MPAILTKREEVDQWLEADTMDALALQRPLSDDDLRNRRERRERGWRGGMIRIAITQAPRLTDGHRPVTTF
jgi:hypothetical protein